MALPATIARLALPPAATWHAGRVGLPARTLLTQPWPARRHISTHQRPARAQLARPLPERSAQERLAHSVYAALQYSSRPGALGSRRPFSSTAARLRDHHFDTLKFVQRLREEGFSEEQATAMMRVLADVIEESIQNLTRTMVPREDAERAQYTQKVDFTKLRSELLQADGTEAQATRQTHERLANDIAKLSQRLRDEIARTQASVRLDLNLEKGRVREEANSQETKIKETESKIEQEVAGLHERIEGVKFDTLRWLLGFFTGISALMLGAWRLFM